MDKWFFIEVQTYGAINNMGLELGDYVYDKYNQTVVHQDCFSEIAADIHAKMQELQEKHPRCKAFKFKHIVFTDKYGVRADDLAVKKDDPYYDNYVFILRSKYIRKMNLETSLNL